MRAKTVAAAALGLFVVASVAYMAAPKPARGPAPSDAARPIAPQGKTVVVYYFYDNVRCATCRQIEALTKQVLSESFARSLADGRLVWRPLNTDEPANRHYLDDYGILSKSVVVSELRDGRQVRWSNLKRVWELVHDEPAFKRYVRDGVAEILETN